MSLFEVEPFFFFFCKKGFHVNLTSGKLLEFSNWELTKRSFSRFLVFFFSRKILIWEVFVREACTTPLIWLTVGGCSFSFHEHTSYEAFHVNLKHNRYFWFSLKTMFFNDAFEVFSKDWEKYWEICCVSLALLPDLALSDQKCLESGTFTTFWSNFYKN